MDPIELFILNAMIAGVVFSYFASISNSISPCARFSLYPPSFTRNPS